MRRAPRNLLVLLILVLFGVGAATVIVRRGDETKTATGPSTTTTSPTTPTTVAGPTTPTTLAAGATTSTTRSTVATTTTVPGATTTTTSAGATTTTPTIAEHPNTGGGGALGLGLGFLVAGAAGLAVVHRRCPSPGP